MSANLSLLTIDTSALQETVAQVCTGQDRLEAFLHDVFGDLNTLADEIVKHGQWIDSSRAAQEAQQSEHEARLGQQRQALEDTFERIQELTGRLETSAVAGAGGTEQFQYLLEKMEAERASFQASLETSESERLQRHAEERKELEARFDRIEKLAETLGESGGGNQGGFEPIQEVLDELREGRETWRAAQSSSESASADLVRMADDLAATRQDLAEAREELRAQRELLHRASTGSESSRDPEIHERLERLEQERLDWARERAALETELDAVRNRAAELSDTLEDERQRANGDRKDWAGEMRQMRELLQTLSERPAVAASEAAGSTPATPVPAGEQPVEQQDTQDPVLDSVMAQFEILQKDLARRRKAKPASK